MKTTLDIDDGLLSRAKALAAQERTSLTRLIEEGLNLRLRSKRAAPRVAKARALPVFTRGGGLRGGIDPLSNRSLLDAADDHSA